MSSGAGRHSLQCWGSSHHSAAGKSVASELVGRGVAHTHMCGAAVGWVVGDYPSMWWTGEGICKEVAQGVFGIHYCCLHRIPCLKQYFCTEYSFAKESIQILESMYPAQCISTATYLTFNIFCIK